MQCWRPLRHVIARKKPLTVGERLSGASDARAYTAELNRAGRSNLQHGEKRVTTKVRYRSENRLSTEKPASRRQKGISAPPPFSLLLCVNGSGACPAGCGGTRVSSGCTLTNVPALMLRSLPGWPVILAPREVGVRESCEEGVSAVMRAWNVMGGLLGIAAVSSTISMLAGWPWWDGVTFFTCPRNMIPCLA